MFSVCKAWETITPREEREKKKEEEEGRKEERKVDYFQHDWNKH